MVEGPDRPPVCVTHAGEDVQVSQPDFQQWATGHGGILPIQQVGVGELGPDHTATSDTMLR